MKQTVKRRRGRFPLCAAIAAVEPAAMLLMEDYEIETMNAYYHFSTYIEIIKHYNYPTSYALHRWIQSGLRKLEYIEGLASIDLFMQGHLTQKEFLEVPIKFHKFPTRLHHALRGAELFNLTEIVELGLPALKRMRGFGVKSYLDISAVLDKKGLGNLLS